MPLASATYKGTIDTLNGLGKNNDLYLHRAFFLDAACNLLVT